MQIAPAIASSCAHDEFEANGCLIVSDLLSGSECAALKVEGRRALDEDAEPGSTVFVGLAARSPVFHRLASHPRIVEVLAKLMPDGVMFLSDKLVFKSGVKRFGTPWHYDQAYWVDTRPKLSVWIALDAADEDNGALTVIPGSHRRTWRHEWSASEQTNGEFNNVITELPVEAPGTMVCRLPIGGAVFFTDRLVHGSCANRIGADRYAVISTYHAPAPDEPFDLPFTARHVVLPGPAARAPEAPPSL